MKKYKKILILFVLLFFGAISFIIIHKRYPKDKENIILEKVKKGDLSVTVTSDGVIVPKVKVDIRSKIQGRIKNVFIEEGDKIKSNDLIAQIEQQEFQAKYEEQKANLQIVEAELEKIKLLLNLQEIKDKNSIENQQKALQKIEFELIDKERNLNRLLQLKEKDLVSQSEVEKVKLSYDSIKTEFEREKENLKMAEENFLLNKKSKEKEIKLAEARVASAKANLKYAEEALIYTRITSPISGIVTFKGVEIGDMVAPEQWGKGSGTVIATVCDLSSLFVETNVDEVDIGKIKLKQEAEIIVDAYPDYEIKGKVEKISYQASKKEGEATSTFNVKIRILNPNINLKPGMNCKVNIKVANVKDTLYIPIEAVLKEGKKEFVNIKVKDKILKREIKTGISTINSVQVISGLKENNEIVIPPPEVEKE